MWIYANHAAQHLEKTHHDVRTLPPFLEEAVVQAEDEARHQLSAKLLLAVAALQKAHG